MVSLIRTNWINVQEFVSASVLAGLRMEEIKGNKRDLYAFWMSEYVYMSVWMCVANVCIRGEGRSERDRGREEEIKEVKGKRAKPSENGPVEQNEKERRGSLTLSLESDSSQSQYNGATSSHLLPRV